MGNLYTEYEHVERTADQDCAARLYVAEKALAGEWTDELARGADDAGGDGVSERGLVECVRDGQHQAKCIAPVVDEIARARVKAALTQAADDWQTGEWANAPRRSDRVAERFANAQYVTDWLRNRALSARQDDGERSGQ